MSRISVVIPAFHSDATVAGCLEALRAQTFRDFQVILVNSSRGDRTPRIVRKDFPEIELIESPVRLLPHEARNHGVERATGEILVFTDPDCRARPDWLAWLAASCDAGHHVVGGPILAAPSATRTARGIHIAKFHMALGAWPTDGGRGPSAIRRDLPTANACYTRTAWRAVGPFPATYMCGDSLLAQRAHNRGYGVWFEPRAVVEHVGSGDVRGFVRERYRRGREYGRAIWALGDRSRAEASLDVLLAPARVVSALVRVGRHSVRAHQGRHFAETLPLQFVAHAAWCAGEAAARVGQAFGRGLRPEPTPPIPIAARPASGAPSGAPSGEVIVIGAGPAGLAVAACLEALGKRATLLERGDGAGARWRGHYDSLHLHTTRGLSELPMARFGVGVSRYPSRDELAAYLAHYREAQGLDVRVTSEVKRVRRGETGWIVETTAGRFTAPVVVVAAGFNRVPVRPRWPGQDGFLGRVLHSAEFQSGAGFSGQHVLVVGLGNSAADIAVDLVNHGARVTIAARDAVFIVPREIAGVCWRHVFRVVPELAVSVGSRLGRLGAGAASAMSACIWYGIQIAHCGDLLGRNIRLDTPPRIMARWRARQPPLIAEPLVKLIRNGQVRVQGAIEAFESDGVRFADGGHQLCDAVVLATGFRPALEDFVEDAFRFTDEAGVPLVDGAPAMAPDIFFCGYQAELSAIGRSARDVARAIAGRL